jgi:hypothetical protein
MFNYFFVYFKIDNKRSNRKKDIIPLWKFYIIESAIQFCKGDNEGEESSILKKTMNFNPKKYGPL